MIITHILSIPPAKRSHWGEVMGPFLAPLISEHETKKMIFLSQAFPKNKTIQELVELGRKVLRLHEEHPTIPSIGILRLMEKKFPKIT